MRGVLTAFACACLVSGCAPLANLRPVGGLVESGRSVEVGGGVVGLSPRPYVIEDWQLVGQIWGTLVLSPALDVSLITAFDEEAALGGASIRYVPLRLHPVAVGAELELGYAWGAIATPFAVEVIDGVWLYSAPRLGSQGIHLTPGIPGGVSARLFAGLVVRAEAQISWEQFMHYQRRTHLASGIAYDW